MPSDRASGSPGVSLPLTAAGSGVACRVGHVWARDARIVQAETKKSQSTVLSGFEVHLALSATVLNGFIFYCISIFLNPSLGAEGVESCPIDSY